MSVSQYRMALGLWLLAASHPLFAALTFPGCADPVAGDFKVVDLVGRSATGSPNALIKDSTLLEPLSLYIHPDGRVYWTERTTTGSNTTTGATSAVGRIRVFNPNGNTLKTVQSFNVSTAANPQGQGNPEYGLRNFTLDPDYETNKFAYVIYNPRTTVTGKNVDTLLISRFTMPTLDTLDLATEKKLIKIPFTIGVCCHEGGAMDWDAQGNLYITIGNNTENQQTGDTGPLYMDDTLLAAIGENKDRATRDNPGRVANTMDYRGKILRIKPDNSAKGYSIPAGNYAQKYLELGGGVGGRTGHGQDPEGDLRGGQPEPVDIACRQAHGLAGVRGCGPRQRKRRFGARSRGPRRMEPGQGARVLRLPLFLRASAGPEHVESRHQLL